MKKILDLIKHLFKDADFVMVFVIFCVVFANVIFACTLETCTSCNSIKTPVEESTNIDSIKGVNNLNTRRFLACYLLSLSSDTIITKRTLN